MSLVCEAANIILGFVGRSFFIAILGATYLGVSGVFSNVLTILNFAELGFGTAIVYNLYKPLGEHDERQVAALVNYYRRAYLVIGAIILVVGLALVPFLSYLIGEQPEIKENITLLYVLYLANTVVTYYNAHKKSLLNADQKSRVVSLYHQIIHIVQIVFQIVFLVITQDFIVYLIIQILCNALENFVVAQRANNMYPFLKEMKKEKLDSSFVKSIRKDVGALAIYKLNSAVMHGTDNILITALETNGVRAVGLYSNYTLITETLNTFIGIVTNALTPSLGNLNAMADAATKEKMLNVTLFTCAWAYGFACAGVFSLSGKFIVCWLGEEYLLSAEVLFAIVLQLYIRGVHYAAYTYRVTTGLFVQSKYVPVAAAVLNIVLSIWFGYYWGLFGILIASSVTRILTFGISDPYLVYKHVFHRRPGKYYGRYMLYAIFVLACWFAADFVMGFIATEGWLGFVVSAGIFTVVFNVLFAVFTFRLKEFKYLVRAGKSYAQKIAYKFIKR